MKFVFIALIFIPLNAFAELHDCNGVWTNKSCTIEEKESLPEVKTADSVKLKDQSQKKSLFHVLNMKSIRANNDYGIKLNLTLAEDACSDQDSSIENCRLQIKELDAVLDEKIKVAAELKIKEKELKLQEEANKLQEERNKIEQDKPNVVVVERRNIIIPRDYLRPHNRGSSLKIESKGNDTKVEFEVKSSEKKVKEKVQEETKAKHTAATVK